MTTLEASGPPPDRRITVEDIDRALDFVLSLTVFFKDTVLLDVNGPSFPLPFVAQKSREPRGLYWAPEAYRPNQHTDLHRQELRHAARVLDALSRGDFLIPSEESPWEDWDGLQPVEAGVEVSCPDCQTYHITTPEEAAAKLETCIRAIVAVVPPLTSEMRDALTALLRSTGTSS